MGIYSLGSIWPDRRQQDLHITISKFCNQEETEIKLVEFLSTVSMFLFTFEYTSLVWYEENLILIDQAADG